MGKGAGECDRQALLLAPAETSDEDRRSQRGPAKKWTEDRVEAELAPFLRGRDTWPTQAEFKSAGLWTVMTCGVYKTGGPARWAQRFGLTPPKSPVRTAPVMDAMARGFLSALVEARRPFETLPCKSIPIAAAAMQVLLMIRSDPYATLNAIGTPLGMTRFAVAPLLEELSEQGLMTEVVNPEHGRRRIRRLTEQGEVLVKRFLLAQLKADMADPDQGAADRPANQHSPLFSHSDAA